MSDSRLEKFIYAICSMDVTDLPVPLSRIEKLWNCLITGEIPDFEPLSRNEKYLMAMLDRYDISNLPAPMSRGEKLLYKIAVGETDLSDVPGYLSRYEELLKYLIENGGIGNFEYVLHTLNQSLSTLYSTAEKPVKSAILKGQTLVNLASKKTTTLAPSSNDIISNDLIKSKTTYIIAINVYTLNESSKIRIRNTLHDGSNSSSILDANIILGKNIFTVTTVDNAKNLMLNYHNSFGTSEVVIDDIVIIEDNHANIDIPYFEGMQSVKMPVLTVTGNNLLNGIAQTNGYTLMGSVGAGYTLNNQNPLATNMIIKCKPNTKYTFGLSNIENARQGYIRLGIFDDIKTGETSSYQKAFSEKSVVSFTTSTNASYIVIECNDKGVTDFKNNEMFLYENSAVTTYEPYKSNILTVNEDVELRGIGEVQDTLDCLTGEVTKRVLEYSITGDEGWVKHSTTNTFYTMDGIVKYSDNKRNVISDKFYGRYIPSNTWLSNMEICVFGSKIGIGFDGTLEELIEYLKLNNPRIFYVDEEKSVKTVVLTVVNQDNQPAKLGTFENITHVSLESAGLIPEVAMEVATHISKELASASPLMDDISTKQEQLNTTVDEQSNNVDATMIATTEIYEETL